MNKLPMGWVWTELGQIANWSSGGTPSRKNPEYYNGDISWIKTGDLGEKYINQTSEHITQEAIKNSSAKLFPKGSVALAMYGATIGKTSILGIDATTNQACAVALPNDYINNEFLYYLLLNEKDNFILKGQGGAQPNISQTVIKNHEIPLPPKAEQDHIATLLDNHLSQVATIRQKLNDILPIIKQFRQSVLAQAVSGRLTEDWRESNKGFSAKDDYESYLILENHKDKITKEKIKLRQDKKFQIENHQIESWITLPFFELSLLNRGFDLPASQRIEGEYPVISSSGHNGTHNQFTVKAPCITVGRSGSVGKVFYCNQDCWALNTALYVKSFGFSDPKFIYWKLVSMDLAQYSSSTAVPTLNRNEFMFEPVSVPPLPEQQQIVAEVERLFAVADSIETQVNAALARVENLTQSILHQAFIGNLSADWRACNADLITGEHSAAALLDTLKANAPNNKTKKPKKSPPP